jgi:hypothetical protein
MTQSKKPDFESTINISELGLENIMEDDTITIDLNNTYGTTTTYWAGDSVTDVVYHGSNDGTFTITDDATTINIGDWNLSGDFGAISINPHEVEKMCKEYPALEKVWRNFKTVYDMVQQDYKGKKQAGEIDDDDIPF